MGMLQTTYLLCKKKKKLLIFFYLFENNTKTHAQIHLNIIPVYFYYCLTCNIAIKTLMILLNKGGRQGEVIVPLLFIVELEFAVDILVQFMTF